MVVKAKGTCDQVYKVYDEHTEQNHDVHVRRMRPLNASRINEWNRFWAERGLNQGYEAEVSSILDMRGGPNISGPGAAEFLVRWRGYEDWPEHDKWTPLAHFASKDVVHAFLRRLKLVLKGKHILSM
jgi:hypothetical protein